MKIEETICNLLVTKLTQVVLLLTLSCRCLAESNNDAREISYTPYLRFNYTFNFKASDSFFGEYMSYAMGEYDLSFSAGIVFLNTVDINLELRNSYIEPSLKKLDYQEKRHLLTLLEKINNKNINTYKAQSIFAINRAAIFLNLYKTFFITENLNLMLGGGLGIAAVKDYQGFRNFTTTDLGKGSQINIFINYNITDQYIFYTGYNYFKNSWVHQTSLIEDEQGNVVFYSFENLEFSSHGISFGLIYKF